MNDPTDVLYTESHEWIRILPNGNAQMGITSYAQEEMGDLVYIELPEEGDSFTKGDDLAVVESVKATSDVYSPIGGIVVAVNEEIEESPELVNEDCYEAWFVEMSDIDDEDALLTPEEYEGVLKLEEDD